MTPSMFTMANPGAASKTAPLPIKSHASKAAAPTIMAIMVLSAATAPVANAFVHPRFANVLPSSAASFIADPTTVHTPSQPSSYDGHLMKVALNKPSSLNAGARLQDRDTEQAHASHRSNGCASSSNAANRGNINSIANQEDDCPSTTETSERVLSSRTEGASTPRDRRLFFASSLFGAGALLTADAGPSNALEAAVADSTLPNPSWVKDPINKRFGVTVDDATKAGYNDAFITYLTRFLLNFDKDTQALWFTEQPKIPLRATEEQIDQIRLEEFAQFAASISANLLQNYAGSDGPTRLLQQLKNRYCPADIVNSGIKPASASKGVDSKNDDPASKKRRRQRREAREAQRQLAILFGLLGREVQPTKEITKLLGAVDNASFQSVVFNVVSDKPTVLNGFTKDDPVPAITLPPPQAEGDQFKQAAGVAKLTPTGKILRVKLDDGGAGYDPKSPPTVTIAPPASIAEGARPAVLKANIVARGPNKGSIESIDMVDFGAGYANQDKLEITIEAPTVPEAAGGENPAEIDPSAIRSAKATALLDLEVTGVQITEPGSGYAAERPIKVLLELPPTRNGREPERIEVGKASPQAEKTSYTSFRKQGDTKTISEKQDQFKDKYKVQPNERKGTDSNESEDENDDGKGERIVSGTASGPDSGLPALPFLGRASQSEQLLSLLPEGFGLEYDVKQKYYFLSVAPDYLTKYTNLSQQPSANRPLVPDFGPRGRSPIERDMKLGLAAYLRFSLSGAICASGVHLALTPLDVVKTKVQTNPSKYASVGSSFGTVLKEEGASTFFTGWVPTFLGNFVSGATLYALTEVIRRSLTEAAGVDALSLEVPIILAAAAVASAVGSIIICPFEAVRIRSVAQPDYAPNAFGVCKRLLDEEGIGSLVNAIPVFLAKNIPYAMVKFTVFDLSTEYLFHTYPIANEQLELSLLISLIGGILGGTSAAIVSNPADAVISELKKAKSDMSPQEAVTNILDRGGVSELFKGLPLRMVFYSLVASLQFSVYDGVRFALGIGADDLKLYLDILGGALAGKGGPI